MHEVTTWSYVGDPILIGSLWMIIAYYNKEHGKGGFHILALIFAAVNIIDGIVKFIEVNQ